MRALSKVLTQRWAKALWLPCTWILLLGLELSFIMDVSLQNKALRILEDLIFIMSFLFYKTNELHGYDKNPVLQFLVSVSLQFVFWWGISYGYLYVKEKLNQKGGSNVKKYS